MQDRNFVSETLTSNALSQSFFVKTTPILSLQAIVLRRNPIEDGAISGFSGQKSVPE